MRDFVERHRKPDGAYGLEGAPDGSARPTAWALRIHELLGTTPPRRKELLQSLASLRPGPRSEIEETLALLRCYRSLDAPIPEAVRMRAPVRPAWPDFAGWQGSDPLTRLADYGRMAAELGRPWTPGDRRIVERYLTACRVGDSGTFGYPLGLQAAFACLAARRPPGPADAWPDHPASLEATTAGLALLRSLRLPLPASWPEHLERWRRDDGGYGWTGGLRSDLEATRRVVAALSVDGKTPPQPETLLRWLRPLLRPDGGVAPGAGESSSLEATWQAMEIVAALGIAPHRIFEADVESGDVNSPLLEDPEHKLHLFQAVVEMGPPASIAVELARRIGADLVLVKANDHESEVAERMNAIAASRGLHVRAACGREEYMRGLWGRPGVGYATHASDILFRPWADVADRGAYESFDALAQAWQPVREAGGLVLSCSWLHRELLSPALEHSCRAPGGWDALMVSWAFARNGDVLEERPWLARYVPRLAVIGNHDAHQECFQWLPFGLRTRTLFFAKSGDFDGFRDAVLHRRTVAVAHQGERLRLSGRDEWVARARAERGRWDLGREDDNGKDWWPAPLAVPIDAASMEDLPTLESGYGLLVRAARGLWDDAMPDEVHCTVDGRPVELALTPPLGHPFPALWCPLPDLRGGVHRVEIEAFGRRTATTLRFGDPVTPHASPPRLPEGDRRSRLSFDAQAETAFVRTWPRPVITRGALRLSSPRTDVFLFNPADSKGAHRLRLRWRQAKNAAFLDVFINGHLLQHMDRPGSWLVHIPESLLIEGFQRVSFRTPLAPWRPLVHPNPVGPRILDIALEDAHE